MKFQLAINLERLDNKISMEEVKEHSLSMVKMAEQGGFEIVWAAEHHALEMTIAPNPFQILTWWASHTESIRLGTAVAVAAYWNPIRLAGEAAFTDLISKGRLEFGIGSGAYQREFDRMRPGLNKSEGSSYMQEMVPILQQLWAGDLAYEGEHWSFPTATSVPKPLQKPHPPIWIAARSPTSFDYAVENGFNIMAWPLTKPMAEVELYMQHLENSLQANPSASRPTIAMMRHTALYQDSQGRQRAIAAVQRALGQFENLFRNLGDVKNGFPKQIPLTELVNREDYEASMLEQNLMFGTPDEVIEKIKAYQALGADAFIYYASMGLNMADQKQSMQLFCDEVIPAFRS